MNYHKLAAKYFGGLAHNHTVLSNHSGHKESDLTPDKLVKELKAAGLAGVPNAPLGFLMLNEHPSDPAKPRKLGALSLRGRSLLAQRRRQVVDNVKMYYGLEVSLLDDGTTDLTPRLADHCALVIASRHRLAPMTERDPASIMRQLQRACANPHIEVIGHPPRYIEDLEEVKWDRIFNWAAETGTAIEVNVNAFPPADADPIQLDFWPRWLKTLAKSDAQILVGTDLHNLYQLDQFILQWQSLDQQKGRRENQLARFLEALVEAKIGPERIVTASASGFAEWLKLDKAGRSKLR